MIFGVLIGTYSSIFIAAPILVYLGLKDRPEKENEAEKRADGAAV
jgi:SecD/SecF fusion protein